MKVTLVYVFVGLLMVGTFFFLVTFSGDPDLDDPETLDEIIAEAIDHEKLQTRGGVGEELAYAPNQQTPYSGWAKLMYDNGQIKRLIQWKDGRGDGLGMMWYENGQKKGKGRFKDGKKDGSFTSWHERGQKDEYWTYKNGKPDGPYTEWHPNGQKMLEGNYWDGEKHGLWTEWDEDGRKKEETRWEYGVRVTYGGKVE